MGTCRYDVIATEKSQIKRRCLVHLSILGRGSDAEVSTAYFLCLEVRELVNFLFLLQYLRRWSKGQSRIFTPSNVLEICLVLLLHFQNFLCVIT